MCPRPSTTVSRNANLLTIFQFVRVAMRPSFMSSGLPAILSVLTAPTWAHGSVLEARSAQALQICNPPTARGEPFHKLGPCGKSKVIEELSCKPENGGPAALQKHASCMCKGDFFDLKRACERCIRDHGGMSEQDFIYWDGILERARNDLCGAGTPAAPFATIWSAHRDVAVMPTSAATVLVDELGTATDGDATQTTVQKLAEDSDPRPTQTDDALMTPPGTKAGKGTPLITDASTLSTSHKTGLKLPLAPFTTSTVYTNWTTGHRFKRPYETGGRSRGRPGKDAKGGKYRKGKTGKDEPDAGMQVQVAVGLLVGIAGMAALAVW